ncbi:DNA-binding transcriptional regulator, LacI/PurR family [Monaibacterium marinum]|uniref:DNA-binding transcriptional regulator, LacI/PurR family n=1 Tax=Pontivivens marinum TaxID=1690039 RepID=A0A2C9CNX8_9RHOB|nr:LacI family DNA-binding transcriptional regulator [Monaibacterium marinum]SOH92908.1 DNA-binding transcriptional regulator, LacI/PurR family [Monaibacterium marinum]
MIHKHANATDVANLAGVSRSAVSRTFTEGASVSPETRAKVMEAAEELGYRVNFLARSLIRQRSELVALVVSDMDHSFRAALVDLLSRKLVAKGFRPVLLPWSEGDEPRQLIDMMLQYNLSGAIVTSDTPPAEIAADAARHGVPLVLVNKASVDSRVAHVNQDADAAGHLAAMALFEAGCQNIVYAGQARPSFSIDSRRASFLMAVATLGMTHRSTVTGGAQNHAGGMRAAQAFLEQGIAADGVYCCNDFFALGFLDGLRGSGIRVPHDLAIVGCDDIVEASWPAYDLTSVRQDTDEIAEACMRALADRIADPHSIAPRILTESTLVRRGSTARKLLGG